MAPDTADTFRTSAAAYDRHIGRYGSELGRALIGFAGISAGARVLDVGAGTGLLTAELVAAVGQTGSVSAVEPSPPFVQACRSRAATADVHAGRAEDLPFVDGWFDAALAQLVVNFMTDPLAGVREMRRVTRDAGTVAACVWDYADQMTLLRTFWDAAVALDPAAEALAEANRMAFCDPDALRSLWEAAGLSAPEVAELRPTVRYADFPQLWEPLTTGVAPSGAYTVSLDDAHRAALHDELFRRLGSHPGPFTLSARAWAVRGRR